jgi:hypothetical protein
MGLTRLQGHMTDSRSFPASSHHGVSSARAFPSVRAGLLSTFSRRLRNYILGYWTSSARTRSMLTIFALIFFRETQLVLATMVATQTTTRAQQPCLLNSTWILEMSSNSRWRSRTTRSVNLCLSDEKTDFVELPICAGVSE